MEKYLNSEGYDLVEVSHDEWTLHVKSRKAYTGNFKKVVIDAVMILGFDINQIEVAIEEMIKYGHNGAHFGMYKGFIYTFQRNKYEKAS